MFRIAGGAILWLLALIAGPALAASPYPQSTLITGIDWDVGSYRWTAEDADIWPITWAGDDALVAAWGDAEITCADKASYGVAAFATAEPSATLNVRHCGPGPHGKGKMMAMVASGSQLYTRFNPQDGSSGFPVWRSGDGGRTWTKPSAPLSFLIDSFVQFGRANSGAPGGYVYALENRTTGIFLVRAPAASVQTNSAYQYFSGTTTAPAWSSRRADAKSIFTDPAGIQRPSITYVPGLDRYLLAAAHSKDEWLSGDRLGIFEAPEPWGPWRTVSYVDDFLNKTGGKFLGMNFPIKWQADGGRTLWATFSCYDKTGTGICGPYHDRFNLMKATLRVGGTVANRAPVAGADSAATEAGKAVTIAVLANDSDPDGDALTVTAASNPPKGTSTVSTDKKSIRYQPDAGYKGSDSFSYTVSDGRGGTAQGSVAVAVGSGPLPAPVYLGCYADINGTDLRQPHDLRGFVMLSAQMTVAMCTATCGTRGFSFAGPRNGQWCFCGNSYNRYGTSPNCSTKCSGDTSKICGGYGANSVYRLG